MDAEVVRRKLVGEAADKEGSALARVSKLSKTGHVEKVNWDEVHLEHPIGYGGFSQVFRVTLWNNPDTPLALKCLNPNTKLTTKSFKTGAVDLAIEAEILSRLEHENVIQLHAIYGGPQATSYLESDRGFFLVLDLLDDTLLNRLDKYRMSHPQTLGGNKRSSGSKTMTSSVMMERVAHVAVGVTNGMKYLHSMGVCLRDLKPDNVGFDSDGVVKIFDLGFAREEHTIRKTEVAGSLRYMAPEVALAQGSVLASDVYSFGVLLWELCTLEKPYSHMTSREEFTDAIIVGRWRHSTSTIPNAGIRKLIKQCWKHEAEERPTFSHIYSALKVELASSEVPMGKTSSKKAFGSTQALRRINTWTTRKISTSGFSRLMGRSSTSKKSDDGTATTEDYNSSSSKGNASFGVPTTVSEDKEKEKAALAIKAKMLGLSLSPKPPKGNNSLKSSLHNRTTGMNSSSHGGEPSSSSPTSTSAKMNKKNVSFKDLEGDVNNNNPMPSLSSPKQQNATFGKPAETTTSNNNNLSLEEQRALLEERRAQLEAKKALLGLPSKMAPKKGSSKSNRKFAHIGSCPSFVPEV